MYWSNLIRHFKSHWKQHSLWRWFILPHGRFTSNKYFLFFSSFPFSYFRCSCSRKCHSKNVGIFAKVEKTASPSFTEREKKNQALPLSKLSFVLFCWISVVWLIAINFKYSANPITREFHPVWKIQSITFSFFLNYGLPWMGYP